MYRDTPPADKGLSGELPLAYRVVRGGLWVAASSYFNIGFGFLANLVLTRILAPEHFGIFALAGFFFSLINLRPKLGIGYALGQRKETTGELAGTHLVLDITAGLISLGLAGIAVPILRVLGYSWDVVWVTLALAGVGISDSIMGTAWILLDKGLLFRQVSLVSSVAFPLSYAPAFALALRGAGYWSLVAQNATYAVLLLVGMWWAVRRSLPHLWNVRWRFERKTAVELVRFGAMVGLALLAGMLVTQFDSFLVGTFVGVGILGFYDRAYRMAQWPNLLVTNLVNRAGFYTYARLQDDPVRLQKTVTMTLWLSTALALPMAMAVFASAPELVRFLYGERWLPSALFLRFLILFAAVRPILDNASALFTAVGKPRLVLLTVTIEAVILIVAGVFLTRAAGAVGTCIAVGLAFGIGLGIRLSLVHRIIPISLWSALASPGFAALLTLGACMMGSRLWDMSGWPLVVQVVAKGISAALLFFMLLWALQPHLTLERARYAWQLAVPQRGKRAGTSP